MPFSSTPIRCRPVVFFTRRPYSGYFVCTLAFLVAIVGLAIIVAQFRSRATVNVDEVNSLKG